MDLARAMVEHPMWAWHIGMVAERGARVYDIGKGFAGYEVPDINHPATKGWLLHMLREACETPRIWVEAVRLTDVPGEWSYRACGFMGCGAMGWQATEGEALAAALLAVWGDA